MNNHWKEKPLGQLLHKSENWLELDPKQAYKEVTVKLWGKGVVLRKEVFGANVASAKRNRVQAGEFILSRIDARNGAFGIIPKELDGAIVSNDFPVFSTELTLLDPLFLEWKSKTREFVELCKSASEGTTNRVRLDINKFLSKSIKIPSLPEQKRIVAKIDALASKIEEARRLCRLAAKEAAALLTANSRKIFANRDTKGWQSLTVEECCEAIIDYRGRTPPVTDEGIPHITSANVKNGTINWATSKYVSEETYDAYMTRGIPKAGDVIFTMEAPLGDAAVIPDDRRFSLAQRTLLLRAKSDLLEGPFLAKALTSPDVHDAIYAKATGTTVKGIASKRLKLINLPVPPLVEQRRIVKYLNVLQIKAEALTQMQSETTIELDALLPSILDRAFKGKL